MMDEPTKYLVRLDIWCREDDAEGENFVIDTIIDSCSDIPDITFALENTPSTVIQLLPLTVQGYVRDPDTVPFKDDEDSAFVDVRVLSITTLFNIPSRIVLVIDNDDDMSDDGSDTGD
jgi:hypothetical protein